jgi:FkbM family methyltransferase
METYKLSKVRKRRPLIIRMLPARLRTAVFFRIYYKSARGSQWKWAGLYESAQLSFAPKVRMKLSPGDIMHEMIAFTGFYELCLTRNMVHAARRLGGTLVDVGANYGYYSLLWAAQNPRNNAVAFEASPSNIHPLADNVEKNGLTGSVRIENKMVGKDRTTLRFSPGMKGQTGWGGIASPGGLALGQSEERNIYLQSFRLDEELDDLPSVEILKIDVEGAEAWVLMGAASLLSQRRISHIYYEDNESRRRRLNIPDGCAEGFLSRMGYLVERVEGVDSLYHAYPRFGVQSTFGS